MAVISTLYVTGYRNFELGIFQEQDEKITRIKKVLTLRLRQYLAEGLNWVLVSGNLGVEMWVVDVCQKLKEEYPQLQVGLIYPFQDFGSQWKENNQLKKQQMESLVDYQNATSHQAYQNPSQLRAHTQFLLEHSQGALLVYDEEFPGKTRYFYQTARDYEKNFPYQIETISFDDLQNYEE